jgi:predicted O-methyltransferase YrrM
MNTAPITARPVPGLPRVLGHRTPRYIYHRVRQMAYERGHGDAPWLTPAAIRLLPTLLRPADQGLEFGSGRSTIWFARRTSALTSVEHNPQWYEKVSAELTTQALSNVDYILAPEDQPVERGDESAYARAALGFPDKSLDFALVDGHYRDYSAKFVLPKIKPGGMLIIDNVNWYLPCRSRAPHSRTAALGPLTPVWAEVGQELGNWRTIWTSSGLWDTAIFIKPSSEGAR